MNSTRRGFLAAAVPAAAVLSGTTRAAADAPAATAPRPRLKLAVAGVMMGQGAIGAGGDDDVKSHTLGASLAHGLLRVGVQPGPAGRRQGPAGGRLKRND